jgi:cytochrome c oxidase subunit II
MLKKFFTVIPAVMVALVSGAANAEVVMRSKPWQMWLQDPMSPAAEMVHDLNQGLMILEIGIVLFVLVLMAYILIKFNEKANPEPSKTTHNTALEVVWTAVPIIILVIVAVPSLKTLYYADHTEEAEMTLKVTGNQWYWSYNYPDHGEIEFDSIFVADEDLEAGQPRLLTVDNPVVLPAGTNIRLLLNSNDVIHNWAIPSLAVKLDTTPGRTNETWVHINEPGDYYGMCSELCGVNHGFMPIHIKALSKAEFAKWIVKAKVEFASDDISPEINTVRLAKADVVAR